MPWRGIGYGHDVRIGRRVTLFRRTPADARHEVVASVSSYVYMCAAEFEVIDYPSANLGLVQCALSCWLGLRQWQPKATNTLDMHNRGWLRGLECDLPRLTGVSGHACEERVGSITPE